jgi:hypothetical protein
LKPPSFIYAAYRAEKPEKLAKFAPSSESWVKEADHSLWLLKRLNQPVQKNPIKTTVAKSNAIVMGVRRRCSSLVPSWLDTRNLSR